MIGEDRLALKAELKERPSLLASKEHALCLELTTLTQHYRSDIWQHLLAFLNNILSIIFRGTSARGAELFPRSLLGRPWEACLHLLPSRKHEAEES